MSDAHVLHAKEVWKVFRRDGYDIQVLKGISLAIHRGETVGVVGVSGAGKTTLLQILGTLDRPTSGKILFDGEDITGLPEERLASLRNRKIGFVFQFHNLLPEFSVLENVMLPCRIAGMDPAEARRRAESLLSEVGMSQRTTHRMGEISGGEQQRVAVCRALIMEPAVLLADEPTGNLDRGTASGMVDLLLDLNRARRLSILMVTHNDQVASRLHRVVRIDDGRIVE
ncbi:MAG: lipoprotein releasing system ATP-binding protein [Deltaproteobacteria bacterium]|nr:lipoprotein releasing system ATP-binding protein [Deltaproteobacteria bacterium]